MGEPRYCLQCDDGTVLEHGTRALSFAYHGATTHVPDVSGWHCPVCGDVEFDAGEGERYSTVVEAFCAARDRELGATVRAIRKKLGLRQSDAGRLFGGGVNAFSRGFPYGSATSSAPGASRSLDSRTGGRTGAPSRRLTAKRLAKP